MRGIESKAGEFYREGLEGSEKRAREAARSDGISVRYGWRRDEFDTLKYSMLEERLEQVREIDGELDYEKMRRAVEKASQEKARQARQVERARQVESARRERAMQETVRQSRAARRALGKLEKRRPERGGPGPGLWSQPLGSLFKGAPPVVGLFLCGFSSEGSQEVAPVIAVSLAGNERLNAVGKSARRF